jgi:uncharacterized protein
MNSQEALAILREHRDALRARGVQHAALFGSLARGEGDAGSDIDILVDLDPAHRIDLFAYAGLQRFIAELFTMPVDVVDRQALKPHIRSRATNDAIYAF